jgi:hypothetical protein
LPAFLDKESGHFLPMSKSEGQKMNLFAFKEILEQETDANHGTIYCMNLLHKKAPLSTKGAYQNEGRSYIIVVVVWRKYWRNWRKVLPEPLTPQQPLTPPAS